MSNLSIGTLPASAVNPMPLPAFLGASIEFERLAQRFVIDMIEQKIPHVVISDLPGEDGYQVITLAGVYAIYIGNTDKRVVTAAFDFNTHEINHIDMNVYLIGATYQWVNLVRAALKYRLAYYVEHLESQFTQTPLRAYHGGSSAAGPAAIRYLSAKQAYSDACDFVVAQCIDKKQILLIASAISKKFWSSIDKKAASTAVSFFGVASSFIDEYHCVLEQPTLRKIHTETPNLAPLLGVLIFRMNWQQTDAPSDSVARLKKKLCASGLTEAGWRYLSGRTQTLARLVAQDSRYEKNENDLCHAHVLVVLNLMAKTQRKVPYSFEDYFISRKDWFVAAIKEYGEVGVVRFLRLAGEQCVIAKKKGYLKKFINEHVSVATDWLRKGGARAINKNATWASIMRAQEQWHIELHERARQDAEILQQAAMQATWKSWLGEFELDGYFVRELNSGMALLQEAQEMAHCVDGYVAECVINRSVIFSITMRSGSQERATLELNRKTPKTWSVVQLNGFKNYAVSKEMTKVGVLVAKRYSLARVAVSGLFHEN